ncbi:hypothetical protein ACFQO9_16355 [Chryseobacterium zhengzhouense]|uniref:Class I SAM-dependent methyltransferase n=1 Tax=Chryseobacterium zhengzhouense TaxID=1636086 RepID=A0ABW2M0B2_9FLAO
MTKAYKEASKQQVRNEALKFAILTLTKNRYRSTIARKTYVRDIKKYLQTQGTNYDKEISSLLLESEIDKWEAFYESIIKKKKASELRVAYLSGPNPENDIEILVNNGIMPENIWAFESDNKTYTNAVISALDSQFPFVKIYKGRIENYLKLLPFKFDIIYLDFCSTIASEKTISVIRDIFQFQKLDTLGILITNFSLPNKSNEENKDYRENLNLLSANYLYPKSFTEHYTGLGGGYRESAECHSIYQKEFLQIAKRNERTFYSQFITRILYDLPSVLIPYQRLASNESLINLFFKNFNKSSFDRDYQEDIMCFPNENSLVWGLSNFLIQKQSFDSLFTRFKTQLSIDSNAQKLFEKIELVCYFITEQLKDGLHSDKLEKINKSWKAFDKYVFCDVFLFHQLKDILIGQLTSPYFYNVDWTKRWTYKAKETEMFMDLITYDECRYIFDWMPTLDMFEEGVEDWNRQLSLRFAMDSITKQRRWYNEEFFNGTAVVDQGTKTFEAKELKKRKVVK